MALAGFASIVSALARRQQDQAAARHRLRVMLLLSLGVVFLSLLPAILDQLGLDLRVAAAIFAGTALLNQLPFSPISRSLRAARQAGYAVSPLYGEFIRGLTMVPYSCAVVALGLFPELAGGIYVGSLACVLLVAAIAFSRLVFSLTQPDA